METMILFLTATQATMMRVLRRRWVQNQDGQDGRIFTMGEKQVPEALDASTSSAQQAGLSADFV
jgi:hypothetical protein